MIHIDKIYVKKVQSSGELEKRILKFNLTTALMGVCEPYKRLFKLSQNKFKHTVCIERKTGGSQSGLIFP